MHAYGTTNGRVRIDQVAPAEVIESLGRGRDLNIEISVARATRLRDQLGVAIHEAELKQIRQLSLVFPGGDAA